MNNMTKFSVLMSIYKNENPIWFREALNSVFLQSVLPDEIVLVEDGPLTQELYDVIEEYKLKYPIFKIIKNEINEGLGLALRKGVNEAKNEILARMDTDDIIPSDRFEKQLKVLNKGYDVVSCWSLLFDESIDNIVAVKQRPERHNDIVKLAHRRSPVCHAACFMRKSAVLNAGNYVNRLYYEDYHLWIRMILNGAKFYNIQEPLYFVRTSRTQVGRRGGYKYLLNEIKIFKEFRKLGFYTINDVIINSLIRCFVRLAPQQLRSHLLKLVWKH